MELNTPNLALNSSCPLHFAKAPVTVPTQSASAGDGQELLCPQEELFYL